MEEMSARFVNIDHDTPLLLPPDLRGRVSADDIVHPIMNAVTALNLSPSELTTGTFNPLGMSVFHPNVEHRCNF